MPGPTTRTPPASVGDGAAPRIALTVVLALVQLVGSAGAARAQPERRSLDLLAVAVLMAGPVALALTARARVPLVTVVVGAVTAAYRVLGYPYGPVVLSLVVALGTAVVTGHRLVAWLVAAAVLAAHGLSWCRRHEGEERLRIACELHDVVAHHM